VNVRVLAATHCDLEKAIEEKRFREDLYYRLNVISIDLPPLRDRTDEILPLSEYFLKKHATPGLPVPVISGPLKQLLLAYEWPGNIRELENVIRKLLVFGDPEIIAEELRRRVSRRVSVLHGSERPPLHAGGPASVLDRVAELRSHEEMEAIVEALNHAHWNRKRAAAALNIDYKGLLYKMKKLGIGPRPEGQPAPRVNGGQRMGAHGH
jgi:two-component system response regulator AtoC